MKTGMTVGSRAGDGRVWDSVTVAVTRIWCLVFGVWCLVSGVWCSAVLVFWCPGAGTWDSERCDISGNEVNVVETDILIRYYHHDHVPFHYYYYYSLMWS